MRPKSSHPARRANIGSRWLQNVRLRPRLPPLPLRRGVMGGQSTRIATDDAINRVGSAFYGNDWIPRLTARERHLIDAYWSTPPESLVAQCGAKLGEECYQRREFALKPAV